jgi:hypothetical protein
MPKVCFISSKGVIEEHNNIYASSIHDHVTAVLKVESEGFSIKTIPYLNQCEVRIYCRTIDNKSITNELTRYICPGEDIKGNVIIALFTDENRMLDCSEKQLIYIFPAIDQFRRDNACSIS